MPTNKPHILKIRIEADQRLLALYDENIHTSIGNIGKMEPYYAAAIEHDSNFKQWYDQKIIPNITVNTKGFISLLAQIMTYKHDCPYIFVQGNEFPYPIDSPINEKEIMVITPKYIVDYIEEGLNAPVLKLQNIPRLPIYDFINLNPSKTVPDFPEFGNLIEDIVDTNFGYDGIEPEVLGYVRKRIDNHYKQYKGVPRHKVPEYEGVTTK